MLLGIEAPHRLPEGGVGLVEVGEGEGDGSPHLHVWRPLARRHVQNPRLEAREALVPQAVAGVIRVTYTCIEQFIK